jgi:uncharacterized protein
LALVLDTGAIYASLDRNDVDHLACRRLLRDTTEVLVVPSPVLVEVEYLVSQRLHPGIAVAFLDDIIEGAFQIADLDAADYSRVREVIERYADSNIGFVDASVLAIVERLGESKLATLDRRHFGMLRPRHVDALKLLPE